MHGIRTRGRRIVGADKKTELWNEFECQICYTLLKVSFGIICVRKDHIKPSLFVTLLLKKFFVCQLQTYLLAVNYEGALRLDCWDELRCPRFEL